MSHRNGTSAWHTRTTSGCSAAAASASAPPWLPPVTAIAAGAARPRQFERGVDRERRVGEHPGVVVVLGAGDAPGHDQGVLRPGPGSAVRRGADRPPAALAPAVHDEHRVAERGQQHVLGRHAAAAAVADELDDHGRGGCRSRGLRYQALIRSPPAPENSTSYTSNGSYSRGWCGVRTGGLASARASVKAPRPPVVEPVRLLRARAVLAQPLKRHVVPGQCCLSALGDLKDLDPERGQRDPVHDLCLAERGQPQGWLAVSCRARGPA